MGASRQSYNIKHYWHGKTKKDKINNLLWLLKQTFKYKNTRKLFIKDNFITSYYKQIGCKYFNEHDLKYDWEDCWCTKCGSWFTKEQQDRLIRRQKIKKLMKKSK